MTKIIHALKKATPLHHLVYADQWTCKLALPQLTRTSSELIHSSTLLR